MLRSIAFVQPTSASSECYFCTTLKVNTDNINLLIQTTKILKYSLFNASYTDLVDSLYLLIDVTAPNVVAVFTSKALRSTSSRLFSLRSPFSLSVSAVFPRLMKTNTAGHVNIKESGLKFEVL